jgi:hypothetical protein
VAGVGVATAALAAAMQRRTAAFLRPLLPGVRVAAPPQELGQATGQLLDVLRPAA